MKQLPTLARAQLAPIGIPPGGAWLRLRQTHLASEAITFSLFMRWLILLISPILILFNELGRVETTTIFVIGLVYNLLLSRAAQVHRHPSLLLTALADVVFISTPHLFPRRGSQQHLHPLHRGPCLSDDGLLLAGTAFALLLSLSVSRPPWNCSIWRRVGRWEWPMAAWRCCGCSI